MTNPILDHLLTRRSVPAIALGEPGPDESQIETMLKAASRVPDHKKLAPWRFILFQGEARARFGRVLKDALLAATPDAGAARLEFEEKRFMRAPLVVAVVSRVTENAAAPEWEQVLSAGAACQNLLVAATAMGYGAQWITEWCAYDRKVAGALGLGSHERIAGFIYIGTASERPAERERPALSEIVSGYGA